MTNVQHNSFTRASTDNHAPGTVADFLDLTDQGSDPSAPAAGHVAFYAKASNLYYEQASGTVVAVPTSALTNPMTTTGDLIYSSDNSGTPARLGAGASNYVLKATGPSAIPVWSPIPAGLTNPMTTAGDMIYSSDGSGTPAKLAAGSSNYFLKTVGAAAPVWAQPASVDHPLPLDITPIDGTYGDDFTASSLSGSWTRRNYTSGAETYEVGQSGTYIRISCAGRAVGDGYFRTAPGGDWTIAMAFIPRYFRTAAPAWGLAVVDTNGTGIGCIAVYSTPIAPIIFGITTYSTYGGNYHQVGASGLSPNVQTLPVAYSGNDRKVWLRLRKSGTNYYTAMSFDGEAWSTESDAHSWSGTVDRIAMMDTPLGTVTSGAGQGSYVDVDWFNRLA